MLAEVEVKQGVKLGFRIDPAAQELRVELIAAERTPEAEALLRRLEGLLAQERIAAYGERGKVLLDREEIIRVYSQKRRVLVDSERGSFALRMRLYEAEERLGDGFVRISNGEIVNRSRILSLDFSLNGTIRLTLRGGGESYVSRRYMGRIKESFGG